MSGYPHGASGGTRTAPSTFFRIPCDRGEVSIFLSVDVLVHEASRTVRVKTRQPSIHREKKEPLEISTGAVPKEVLRGTRTQGVNTGESTMLRVVLLRESDRDSLLLVLLLGIRF